MVHSDSDLILHNSSVLIDKEPISQDLRDFLISLCSSREAIHRYGSHRQLIHQVQRTIQVSYKYLDCALTLDESILMLYSIHLVLFLI